MMAKFQTFTDMSNINSRAFRNFIKLCNFHGLWNWRVIYDYSLHYDTYLLRIDTSNERILNLVGTPSKNGYGYRNIVRKVNEFLEERA